MAPPWRYTRLNQEVVFIGSARGSCIFIQQHRSRTSRATVCVFVPSQYEYRISQASELHARSYIAHASALKYQRQMSTSMYDIFDPRTGIGVIAHMLISKISHRGQQRCDIQTE